MNAAAPRADAASRPAAGAVLVTGASGFIGSAVARSLCAEGRRVALPRAPTSDTDGLTAVSAELCTGTLEDPDALRRAASGCEAIVHCAALVSDWATVAEIRTANVIGTRNVVAAAAGAGVGRLIHLSTTGRLRPPGRRAARRADASGPLRQLVFADEARSRARGARSTRARRAGSAWSCARRPSTGRARMSSSARSPARSKAGTCCSSAAARAIAGLCYV